MNGASRAHIGRLGLALAALAALSLSTGRFAFWPAAWLGPALLARFVRAARCPYRWLLGYSIAVLAQAIAWGNVVGGMSGPLVVLGLALAGVAVFAPYVIDGLYFRAGRGPLATLVLPLSWVTVDLAFSSALADVGFLGYSQVGCLPLLQLASVTGVFGVTFVVTWGASVLAFCAEVGPRAPAARRALLLFGGVLGAVLAWGSFRLYARGSPEGEWQVAGLSSDLSDVRQVLATLPRSRLLGEGADAARSLWQHDLRLLADTEREAARGARAIAWSEASFVSFEEDDPRLLAEASALAQRRGIYLVLGWLVYPRVGLVRNQLVLIAPDGHVAARYEKTRLSPGEQALPGDGRLPIVPSPYGLLSGAICADFSYHRLIAQAGRARAALLFDPSSEWEGGSTRSALFRAVENGAALVKVTRGERSLIADANGRIVASAPAAANTVLRASLPRATSVALYPRLGDLFAWSCVMALVALLLTQRFTARPESRTG